jgi:hypothetical protein
VTFRVATCDCCDRGEGLALILRDCFDPIINVLGGESSLDVCPFPSKVGDSGHKKTAAAKRALDSTTACCALTG